MAVLDSNPYLGIARNLWGMRLGNNLYPSALLDKLMSEVVPQV